MIEVLPPEIERPLLRGGVVVGRKRFDLAAYVAVHSLVSAVVLRRA